MKKLTSIILGWWYYLTNRNNELAQKRLKICAGCEFFKWSVCTVCGCPGQTKARIEDETCPHPEGDKWKSDSALKSCTIVKGTKILSCD